MPSSGFRQFFNCSAIKMQFQCCFDLHLFTVSGTRFHYVRQSALFRISCIYVGTSCCICRVHILYSVHVKPVVTGASPVECNKCAQMTPNQALVTCMRFEALTAVLASYSAGM